MEQLRLATGDDMELLFRWANDKAVRAASFTTDEIAWETHVAWFNRMLDNPNVIQYIYEYDGIPNGQIRITVHGTSGIIGYSVAEEFRGKGRAKRMIGLLEQRIKDDRPDLEELIAEVKPENVYSQRVFLNANYEEKKIFYSKRIKNEEF